MADRLRALAHAYRRPQRLVSALNDELRGHGPESRFLTVAYVEVREDEKAGLRLRTILAGHPPPLLVTAAGEIRRLGSPGTLLGVYPSVNLRLERSRMAHGDTILLYTDGLADAPRSAAVMTDERLAEVLCELRDRPPGEQAAAIEQLVNAEASQRHRRDDVAFLIARCIKE